MVSETTLISREWTIGKFHRDYSHLVFSKFSGTKLFHQEGLLFPLTSSRTSSSPPDCRLRLSICSLVAQDFRLDLSSNTAIEDLLGVGRGDSSESSSISLLLFRTTFGSVLFFIPNREERPSEPFLFLGNRLSDPFLKLLPTFLGTDPTSTKSCSLSSSSAASSSGCSSTLSIKAGIEPVMLFFFLYLFSGLDMIVGLLDTIVFASILSCLLKRYTHTHEHFIKLVHGSTIFFNFVLKRQNGVSVVHYIVIRSVDNPIRCKYAIENQKHPVDRSELGQVRELDLKPYASV